MVSHLLHLWSVFHLWLIFIAFIVSTTFMTFTTLMGDTMLKPPLKTVYYIYGGSNYYIYHLWSELHLLYCM